MNRVDSLVYGVSERVRMKCGYWPEEELVEEFVRENLSYSIRGSPSHIGQRWKAINFRLSEVP